MSKLTCYIQGYSHKINSQLLNNWGQRQWNNTFKVLEDQHYQPDSWQYRLHKFKGTAHNETDLMSGPQATCPGGSCDSFGFNNSQNSGKHCTYNEIQREVGEDPKQRFSDFSPWNLCATLLAHGELLFPNLQALPDPSARVFYGGFIHYLGMFD